MAGTHPWEYALDNSDSPLIVKSSNSFTELFGTALSIRQSLLCQAWNWGRYTMFSESDRDLWKEFVRMLPLPCVANAFDCVCMLTIEVAGAGGDPMV